MNITNYLSQYAQKIPSKKAVVFPKKRGSSGRYEYTHLTFKELDDLSNLYAYEFQKFGMTKGSKTLLFVRPSLDFFALAFAGGMMCFAFMLKSIEKKSARASDYIIGFALLISISNLSYLAFYVNLTNFDTLKHQIKDRNHIYSKFYPQGVLNSFIEKIPPRSQVLLITPANSRIFPFFLDDRILA